MGYKDSAYKVLKLKKKPLHSKKITQIAIQKGWLKPKGSTPESTMYAQLTRDIQSNKTKSRFTKEGPSIFGLNKNFNPSKSRTASKPERKVMNERFVKRSIIQWLSNSSNGWENIKYRDKHEKGVDIKASRHRSSEHFWIETKGQGKIQQIDDSNFLNSLGQIITRMDKIEKRYKFGLGLPYTSAEIALRRLPWQVAKQLSLSVLSVDQSGKVTEYSWQNLKKLKSQKRKLKK